MPVHAIADYVFEPKDKVANFHGNLLVYVHWVDHLLIIAPIAVPLPPDTPFATLIDQVIPNAYAVHPDLHKIDWPSVQWIIDGQQTSIERDKSIADHDVGHKSVIKFITPGLTGIAGTCA